MHSRIPTKTELAERVALEPASYNPYPELKSIAEYFETETADQKTRRIARYALYVAFQTGNQAVVAEIEGVPHVRADLLPKVKACWRAHHTFTNRLRMPAEWLVDGLKEGHVGDFAIWLLAQVYLAADACNSVRKSNP